MATSISSIGVGSGLPLDTLLQQLRTAENAPLAALQTRANKEQQRFTAYGTLKSALDTVNTAAAALGKGETFHAVKASVTGDTFSATTKSGSGAIAGNYAVKVDRLATAQVLTSAGTESRTDALVSEGSGKVNIEFELSGGKTHTLSVDAGASLEDVVKAINNDADLKFSATIMNDGTNHRLMLSADETGTANTVKSIAVSAGEGGEGLDFTKLSDVVRFTAPVIDPDNPDADPVENATGMTQRVAANDAEVTINGIKVTSGKNSIENVIDGVTLTLNKAAAEGAAGDTLRVTRDDTVASTAVTNFVNAYNALQSTIKSLTAYDVDSQSSAALTGDTLARRAQSQVRDALNGLAVDGVTLSSLGIKTDPNTGNLSVDNAKLTEALTNNRPAVEKLFSGEGGLSKRVTANVEVFTKSDGLIKTSQDSITRTLKLLEQQYEQMEARIDQKMETYRAQFVQLDTFMAQMNSTSSYLSQQLSMLANMNSGNDKK